MVKNNLLFPFAFFAGLTIATFISGCSSSNIHYTSWVGAFLIDSVTIGAVRIEYNISSRQFGYDQSSDYKNVNLDLYSYSLNTNSSKLISRLESGLSSSAYTFGSIRYQNPWIAYSCDKGTLQLDIYNTLTNEKVVVKDVGGPIAIAFSRSCKFLLFEEGYYHVYNLETKNQIDISTHDYCNPFYIEELSGYVYINFDTIGIKKYNIAQSSYDSFISKRKGIGTFERVVDYGNAVLVDSNRNVKYCTVNEILTDSIILHNINTTLSIDDLDLANGNVCSTGDGNVSIGNIFNKFNNKIILQSTQEKQ
jgi:hypothetical protein